MKDVESIFKEAELYFSKSQYQKAENLFQKVLELKKNDVQSLFGLSNIKIRTKNFQEALSWIEKVLELNSNFKEAYITKAIILKEMKEYSKALDTLKHYLTLDPNHSLIINEIGILNLYLQNYEETIRWLEKSKNLLPDNFETFYVLAQAYEKLLDYENSIINYKKTIDLNSNFIDAYMNCANLLKIQKKYTQARYLYEKVIHLNKNFAPAYNNLGILFDEIKDYTKALFCFKKAIEINDQYGDPYYNLGNVLLVSLNRPYEAAFYLEKAYKMNYRQSFLLGKLLFCKLSICDWENFNNIYDNIEKDILNYQKVVTAFQSLVLFDSPKINQITSNLYKEALTDGILISKDFFIKKNKSQNKKIKLAYFSGDFREHPMGYLMSDIINLHDRSKFEVYGFDMLKPRSEDKLYSFFQNKFDHFFNIENLSTNEIIELCLNHNIDIAIDLLGHTKHSMPGIFKSRCAPIQINYLGYPGTTGKNYSDYIIVDHHLVDDVNKNYFDEKLIFLPDCYQPNNYKTSDFSSKFQRKDFNLPEEKFVFCCFNNNHKILPNLFNSWMNILKSVEESVLWLFLDNEIAKKNVLLKLKKFGLKENRIVFCDRLDHEQHLSRIKLADLFLDTFPYNAHTTASDAILGGLPILTIAGDSFQSRVAKSILSSLKIKDLICKNFQEYEEKAVKLARDKIFYQKIKKEIKQNLVKSPLGNINLYIQNLEKAYIDVYKQHLENK